VSTELEGATVKPDFVDKIPHLSHNGGDKTFWAAFQRLCDRRRNVRVESFAEIEKKLWFGRFSRFSKQLSTSFHFFPLSFQQLWKVLLISGGIPLFKPTFQHWNEIDPNFSKEF